MTEAEIVECARENVVGIIVGVDPLSASVIERCKHLIAISKYGVGMDNIDLEKAKNLGIQVKNAVGTNNISVAELAIALMFSISRSIPKITACVKNGSWDRVIGCELTGKKLGLIGGGQIGKEVAKRARGLDMKVSIYDPYLNDPMFLDEYSIKQSFEADEIFSQSDFISLHVPVTAETKHIINTDTLKQMKPSAYLINTSRGELVNENDLYEALSRGLITGAAQDVFSNEPPVKEERLLGLNNFILTSHIGAFTKEAVEKMAMVSTKNLLEMLEKELS